MALQIPETHFFAIVDSLNDLQRRLMKFKDDNPDWEPNVETWVHHMGLVVRQIQSGEYGPDKAQQRYNQLVSIARDMLGAKHWTAYIGPEFTARSAAISEALAKLPERAVESAKEVASASSEIIASAVAPLIGPITRILVPVAIIAAIGGLVYFGRK